MHQKLTQLQEELAREEIDCAVIGPTTNMTYLLGGAPHADERLCLLIVTPDRAEIISPELNAESIRNFTDLHMITWADADGPGRALAQSLLNRPGIGTLAVDGSMRADFLISLDKTADPKRTISADPAIGKLRIIKSVEEITALQNAAAQADRAMQAAVEACRPGAAESEVAWATEAAFRKDGAEKVEFTLVAAGANGAIPHHHSGEKILTEGEGIIIDIGASLKGYKSDITRVVFLGEPDREFLDAYSLVLEANRAGRAAVRPGISAGSVDSAVRNVIHDAGFGDYFIHRTGHGIGLDIHEGPYIQQDNPLELVEGMCFSIEPGVYFSRKFGIRIEDIITVREDGQKTLTGFDHSLVIK